MNTRRGGRYHARSSRAYRGKPPARSQARSSGSSRRAVLLATLLVLVAVVAYIVLSRGSSTTTAACLGVTPGQPVRDTSLRRALRGTPASTEILRYTVTDPYGKPIEIVLARTPDESSAAAIIKKVSPITVVASRSGTVVILSTKPLDPDVSAKIADCISRSSWS